MKYALMFFLIWHIEKICSTEVYRKNDGGPSYIEVLTPEESVQKRLNKLGFTNKKQVEIKPVENGCYLIIWTELSK